MADGRPPPPDGAHLAPSGAATGTRLPERAQRAAATVATVARGLGWASFVAAAAVGAALAAELDDRSVVNVVAIMVLVGLLTVPGIILWTFRAAVCALVELPDAARGLPGRARDAHGRIRDADRGVATGAQAARAVWEGGRELGVLKGALAVVRLSFVLWTLVAALLVPVEVLVAIVVVLTTLVL